ncbi:MAG: ARMT1-like domain-containing protein [bacterium]|nr:ARMT1-like domain-containing protein [bacterium]
MRLNPECIPCLLGNQLERYPKDIDNSKKIAYMQAILRVIADASDSMSAPMIMREITKIQRQMFGNEMDYSEIKRHFNQLMLENEMDVQKEIDASEDELKLAIQFAIIGNFIDFGAMKSVNEQKLEEFLHSAREISVNEEEYISLRKDILDAKKITYLTDNCGEIVMDKLLIRVIQKMNPDANLTVLVRGEQVLNDATLEDAVQVGLTEMADVRGNGSDIAGTCIEELSEEARKIIYDSDVILAKGQGNFETMQMCGLNVYYIFMCKCEMFARKFQVPRFTGMLLSDKNC